MTVGLDDDDRFRVPQNVLPRTVGEEMVILDLNSDRYFGLNRSGAFIWSLFADGSTVGAIISTVAAEFDVAQADVRSDLEALVSELRERGLIEPAG
ncbi:PqqD family protein [Tropicimonas isoalkanivorans]|uniref:Coenzyme PQQ synthesis protein D (PqqD) n=1 Tax=Tropicimonas isoalkanivorans TaxID=441112 RepID=A0A1I1NEE4_9RHOB|nr:PqqD family protein [Tropicimonas isoalkanivorans]SFC92080.1 Coenzyme PQQ synthesis protein D (PqqD) [Tropicimonas isoalkanivorans]